MQIKTPHGNTGRQNALKGAKPLDDFLHVRISPELKQAAKQAAADQGISLSKWVCNALESASETSTLQA